MSLPVPTTSAPMIDPRQLAEIEAPLIALTNQCGGDLRRLMFAFFGFLHSRTDFYLVPHPDDVKDGQHQSMGFKEGDAEKLLLAAFRQFPLRRIPSKQSKSPGSTATVKTSGPSTVRTTKPDSGRDSGKVAATPESVAKAKVAVKVDDNEKEGIGNMAGVRYTEEERQIPVGNGGSAEKYKWTQTLEECTVMTGIPKDFRGKDLSVSITPSSVSVKSKNPMHDNEQFVFLEGKLTHKVRADESTWSLEGGVLIITLDKLQKTFWEAILEGDEKIDTTLVDSRRHISDYDTATQGQLRKVLFDENQLRRGLKTSDEILGKPDLPPLPSGVEFINQQTVDEGLKK